mgnify:CR=1 FL=1
MNNEIRFFGLLYLKNNENKNLNFNLIDENQKILVYLKNAILLDKQLKYYNHRLILITNKKNYLNKLLKKLDYKIKLRSIKFNTSVPKKTHFYSCHFRVDVFRYFSHQRNIYSVLLDLDILILNNPKKLINFCKNKIALVNDISQNVIPAYGEKEILKKLRILNSNIDKITWIGGDFFGGDKYFYKSLHKKTKFYQKKFVKNLKQLSDQTDELFMSASLYDLKNNKQIKIKYGNKLSIFNRYWNTNVLHTQKKISFYKKFIFLHIPADKLFLSDCYDKNRYKQNFKLEYFNYVSSIKNILKIKIVKFLPSIIKEKIKYYLFK